MFFFFFRWREQQADSHVVSTRSLLRACSRVHSSDHTTYDRCIFTFLRDSLHGKICCVFRFKSPFSNSSRVVRTGFAKPKQNKQVHLGGIVVIEILISIKIQ